jgi:hypothetical protein
MASAAAGTGAALCLAVVLASCVRPAVEAFGFEPAAVSIVGPADAAAELRADPHWASLSQANLRARGSRDRWEYSRRYEGSILDPSRPEALAASPKIRAALDLALRHPPPRPRGLADRLARRQLWRFAMSTGAGAEAGMPHTVGQLIVLPLAAVSDYRTADLAALIVHEACHLEQRADPAWAAAECARAYGFEPGPPIGPRDRANPDTDRRHYVHSGRRWSWLVQDGEGRGSGLGAPVPEGDWGAARRAFPWCRNPEHPYEVAAEDAQRLTAEAIDADA